MSVASLNREHNSIELAKDYMPGQFVRISGSTVDEDKDRNLIYATKSLNFKKGEGGCEHTMYPRKDEPGSGWDTADAENSWYGAGVVSGKEEKDKFAKSGMTFTKSEIVDAPIINEFPIAIECEFVEYQSDTTGLGVIGKVVRTSVEEANLKGDKVDIDSLEAIAFDPYTNGYYKVSGRVGEAYKDGLKLR